MCYNLTMKLWIKYLLAILLGILAAILLPVNNPVFSSFINFVTELFVRFGRYLVVPLVFSTAIVSVNKLRSSKLFFKTARWTAIVILCSTFIMTIVGMLSILIVKLPRIPITVDTSTDFFKLDIASLILSLFPTSAFAALTEGSFLLVSFIFAVLIGFESATAVDTPLFKPVYQLFDSLSKLFYNIAQFITEIMAFMMVMIMTKWFVEFRTIIFSGIYTPMLIMFIVDFVIVAGIIYPVIIRYICHDPYPYRVLYASIAPALLSFIGGDANLSLPLTIRHGKESLGIRRRTSGFTFPIFSIFSRGGSALVSVISFIVIWRSYSSLNIPLGDILWIFGFSFVFSFLLGGLPSGCAFVLVTILCQNYARGFETSFLLLKPAALIICSFSMLFDTVTAMYGSYLIAVKNKTIEHHKAQHFI
ncbi:Na+/H+-dicarboxylate symporter [Treponema sp. JC4]|nr:Na+/H+-dicarboxylate symporter [Treponema sp. JC4]